MKPAPVQIKIRHAWWSKRLYVSADLVLETAKAETVLEEVRKFHEEVLKELRYARQTGADITRSHA